MPGCIAEVFAANNERRVPNPDATHGRIVPKEEFASLTMEKLTKELILKQEDVTNPEIKSAKQGFAYGPSTSKTAKPYALNTLRKRAKIGFATLHHALQAIRLTRGLVTSFVYLSLC